MARKTNKAVVVESVEVVTPVVEVAEVLEEATVQIEENTAVVAAVEHKVSKAEVGRTIFNEAVAAGPLVRKDVIARLVAEAGLTAKGAATYYQNMKNKAGLVVHKAKEEVAVEDVVIEEVTA
jgi:hypothetical protein